MITQVLGGTFLVFVIYEVVAMFLALGTYEAIAMLLALGIYSRLTIGRRLLGAGLAPG